MAQAVNKIMRNERQNLSNALEDAIRLLSKSDERDDHVIMTKERRDQIVLKLREVYEDAWDVQIMEDVDQGRLDPMIKKARQAHDEGRTTPI